ncbi:sugar ABC transporter permease [Paenibacillus psychroresistens]|uniref:Sugar ABC transporter permease n=1 Tax=Paenibacillus psychroresistens TaxID=1778678 RepID=A0A6B8RGT2_9BACL|nr:ABC transporter permease subunit [Paenibacillus psychroresistens]QGQ95147.1 sugar ABC transporter permease [Paenibacillus psychroresistens]
MSINTVTQREPRVWSPLGRVFKKIKKRWQLYLFVALPVAYFIIFHYIPFLGIVLAFKDYRVSLGILHSPWAGTKYFEQFFDLPFFWRLIRNTLILSGYTLLLSFPAPIILALCLNEIRMWRFKKIVQMVTYAPYLISTVVMVGMIFQFLSPRYGLVNIITGALGIPSQDFMGNSSLFRSIYVLSDVWQTTGYAAVIYIAALAGIDPSLHEAAKIDGASRFQSMRHIDFPCIRPTMIVLLVLNIGGLMNVGFEKVYLMQNPLNTSVSEVIQTYVYKLGLVQGDYSFATAVGLFNSLINLLLILMANQMARRTSDSSLW